MTGDLNDMREQAWRLPAIEAILDRLSSKFKGLEVDVFKNQQGDLCLYSTLNKGKSKKKGCKDGWGTINHEGPVSHGKDFFMFFSIIWKHGKILSHVVTRFIV